MEVCRKKLNNVKLHQVIYRKTLTAAIIPAHNPAHNPAQKPPGHEIKQITGEKAGCSDFVC